MKQTLQLKLSQHLALTPQLQQSIRLLQLSTLDLNQEIEQFLLGNPLLERDEPGDDGAAFVPRPEETVQVTAPVDDTPVVQADGADDREDEAWGADSGS